MVRAACAYLAGTCVLLSLAALPGAGALAALLIAAAVVTFAPLVRDRSPAWPVLGFALGCAAAWFAVRGRLADRLDPSLEGRAVEVRGSVASVPQRLQEGVRFRLATQPAAGLPMLLELTWYEPEWIPRPAERLVLVVKLRRPRGFANPGGIDQEARMLREGVGATGYVKRATREGRGWRDVAARPVLVARGAIDDAIRAALGDRPATGIVAGLAVGLQDALSREQWRELARSGTSHLMAISGMHIGMLAIVAGWFAAHVQRWRQRRGALGAERDAAVLAGSLTALAYALLAGWSVPTQRTVLMIVLVAAALRLRRRVSPSDGLALGAIAVLVLEPLAPLAVGFWLSFVAVAVILFVAAGHVQSPGAVAGFTRVQFAVTVGLVPVMVGSFGSVSLVSAPVNALAIPLYTLVVVPAVLFSTALSLVSPAIGHAALNAVAGLIEWSWPIIAAPASWPLATWGIAELPAAGWIALVVGAAAALAPLPAGGRVAGALMVGALCVWRAPPPAAGAVRAAVLDVGQGLAAVVETRRHVLVYDTGPAFRSGTDTGVLVVEPFLRSRGLRRVDVLVASHDDDDHAGGAAGLAALVEIRHRVASGRALDALGAVQTCRAGQRWTWDGVDFAWLHPADPRLPGDNDGSCVLQVRTGAHSLLLTGDVEAPAEAQLIARGLGPADIVVVPHHGSRTSSSAGFVAATRPRWALVSAGYRNRWGFPAPAVVERWRSAGAAVIGTADSGAVEIELQTSGPVGSPRRWRDAHRRPWTDP